VSLPEVPPSGSLSKAALGPCPETDRAQRLEDSPVHIAPVRRTLRDLTQTICPLIGCLDDLSKPHSLHEWAWFYDELAERAEAIQSQAMALKHMADVMWERVYATGRDEEA